MFAFLSGVKGRPHRFLRLISFRKGFPAIKMVLIYNLHGNRLSSICAFRRILAVPNASRPADGFLARALLFSAILANVRKRAARLDFSMTGLA